MNRSIILIFMLSFFGCGKSNFQKNNLIEEPKGIIGEYYENDFPVIMKFVNELPENKIMEKLPFLTVVSWKYDGTNNNGMPPDEINERMIVLEDALQNAMESSDLFTHAYSRTGNNLKELCYYSTNQDSFMSMINTVLAKHDSYPIEINFYEDKEWSDFKKVLSDFKK